MKKLSIATVGLGRIGFSRHVIIPYEHPNFEVVACMDKVQERLDEVKDLYHVNVYDDYEKMIDNEKIDLVVIASPTNFHYEQTKYALLKGIDVFLEKPMTVTVKETQELVSLAKKLLEIYIE
jgi:predicted dehydrogenase